MLAYAIEKAVLYCCCLSMLLFLYHRENIIPHDERELSVRFLFITMDVRILGATVIQTVLLGLELLQLYFYLSSDWVRVAAACWSVRNGSGIRLHLYQFLCNLPQPFGYWQNKIGQHSLLRDLHSTSKTANIVGSLSWLIFHKLLFQPSAFPRGIFNPGIKGPDYIPLTDEVKLAVAVTLKSSDGRLSNGASALERNEQRQLLWACQNGSLVDNMLIWHVATEYCDIARSCQAVGQGASAFNNRVAPALSNYCAYLIAFVPELLPDHHLETTAKLHAVRNDAIEQLRDDKSLQRKYAKMRNAPSASEGDGVFKKGIWLGKKLEEIADDYRRWEILADVWTEMILYIAPSNNARDHIQNLANGGEFLTHLWALLTHAGILERGQRNTVDIENAGAAQLYPLGQQASTP